MVCEPKFGEVVNLLGSFRMGCAPCRESEIESALVAYLKSRNYTVLRQNVISDGRLDLVIGSYIIEVKLVGQKNIAEQLDRYSGHCNGLIVICWRATKPLKQIFAIEKKTAKIPVELIEVRSACGMV